MTKNVCERSATLHRKFKGEKKIKIIATGCHILRPIKCTKFDSGYTSNMAAFTVVYRMTSPSTHLYTLLFIIEGTGNAGSPQVLSVSE